MFRNVALAVLVSTAAITSAYGQTQSTLPMSDSISVLGLVVPDDNNGTLILQTDIDGNILNDNPGFFTSVGGPGPVFDRTFVNENGSMGAANFSIDYQYGIRERRLTFQQDQTFYSFLMFDVSSLTLVDVNNPTFAAEFSVDYIGSLNVVNGPGSYALGTPTSAWDSVTAIPTTALGESATLVSGSTLVFNSTTATPGKVSVDITDLVRSWVDESIPNYGITFVETNGTLNIGSFTATSQAGYFSNATINAMFDPEACLLGDINQDGAVNFLDITPFITLLSSGSFQCEADINEDEIVNFLDIAPFITLLSGDSI